MERFRTTPGRSDSLHSGQLDPAFFPSLREFVRKEGVQLVLLDTLSTYWRIKDESDNAEIARARVAIPRFWQRDRRGVVLIHHHRKSGGLMVMPSGAAGPFGLVDQALSLDKCAGAQRDASVLKPSDVTRIAREMILELDGTSNGSSHAGSVHNRSPRDPSCWTY